MEYIHETVTVPSLIWSAVYNQKILMNWQTLKTLGLQIVTQTCLSEFLEILWYYEKL